MKSSHAIQTIQKKLDPPGFQYLRFDGNSVLESALGGNRNVEQQLPVDEQTTFHAFSVTKTFTAVAIMQLVDQGKLDLEAPIQKLIPAYRFSKPVSVRQLLSHQSGVRNPLPLKWIHRTDDHEQFEFSTFADAIIHSNLKLKRSPGTRFAYSNVNYLVLGRLIEVISGSRYEDHIAEHVLRRLGPDAVGGFSTSDSNDANGYHPNTLWQGLLLSAMMGGRKNLYRASSKWLGLRPFMINGTSYGGLICNASLLMLFCQQVMREHGSLLPKNASDEMLNEQRTSNGSATGMALGWFTGSHNGQAFVHHVGGGGGFYAEMRIYAESGIGSVLMVNRSGMRDLRLLDALDRVEE